MSLTILHHKKKPRRKHVAACFGKADGNADLLRQMMALRHGMNLHPKYRNALPCEMNVPYCRDDLSYHDFLGSHRRRQHHFFPFCSLPIQYNGDGYFFPCTVSRQVFSQFRRLKSALLGGPAHGHSYFLPRYCESLDVNGADWRNRTADMQITKLPFYQLN